VETEQERHYKITTLNKLFAIFSIVLLAVLIWLFVDDYSREWKKYQREFRDLEIEKIRVKYDLESTTLEGQPEYQELKKKIEEAKSQFAQKSGELKKLQQEISSLKSQHALYSQRYQFAKARYDSVKYHYEEALNHNDPSASKLKTDLEELEKKISQLRLDGERAESALSQKQSHRNEYEAQLKSFEKDQKALTKQIDIYERKLKKIDPARMSPGNTLGDLIRNLPVLDLANPSYRIQQVVIGDIKDSVNFMQVPKVDRCMTCHLGIDNPDYKDAPQPFTTHPNLELFVSNNSAHPLEEFGCTSCHGGRGRGTDFLSSVHTPASEEQKKEWQKKYHGQEFHHWEVPMYPMKYIEASCFKCHSGQTTIPGAEKLNLGLNLIEKAGCFGCHTIDKYTDWPKVGPDLTKIVSKTTKEWTYHWIRDPQSFRHNTWMPSFFGQSNTNDPVSLKRAEQEVQAIVHYLFAKSLSFSVASPPTWGNPQKGEEIINAVGCFGCHEIQAQNKDGPRTRQSLHREHGPNLIGLGTKTSKAWLYNWLKDPNRYHPGTRMPNLRLSDQEAADAAAYLVSLKDRSFLKTPVPKIDEEVLNGIVREFLTKSVPLSQAEEQIAGMRLEEKLMFSGEKLIRHYGCFACHTISGFETDKPIGTELTEEGSKAIDRLDFGFVPLERTRQAWFTQKLKDSRIFDEGRLRGPTDKLRMPNYHFSEEEIDAIVTALLGFVKDRPAPSKMKPRTPRNLSIEEGQKIVRQFNCQGCHTIDGEGGAIQPSITDWLVKFQDRDEQEAQALTVSFSPPDLLGEGKKVQTPWLFEFLHEPDTIRPWLSVRMPTYHFTTQELNALVQYFNALDNEEFPFVEVGDYTMSPEVYAASEKLFSSEYFDCAKCHIVGDKLPGGSPDSWAPNFALAKRRLKPQWIIEWLRDPQDLMPGTKMPTFFDPQNFEASGPEDILGGDEEKQIEALRDYLLTLSSQGPATAGKAQGVSKDISEPKPSAVSSLEIPNAAPTVPEPEEQ